MSFLIEKLPILQMKQFLLIYNLTIGSLPLNNEQINSVEII